MRPATPQSAPPNHETCYTTVCSLFLRALSPQPPDPPLARTRPRNMLSGRFLQVAERTHGRQRPAGAALRLRLADKPPPPGDRDGTARLLQKPPPPGDRDDGTARLLQEPPPPQTEMVRPGSSRRVASGESG
ncbi:unnamed protein product [Gadus morhua 'NCC']